MQDKWCRRLALLAAVWLTVAVALQVIVSLALRQAEFIAKQMSARNV